MKNIKLIKQEDDTGCGIACAAMVSNKCYQTVKTELMIQEKWVNHNRKLYTRINQLKKLLDTLSIDVEILKSSSWDHIKGCAIVGVNRKTAGYFHWVVVIKDINRFLIIDPEEGEVYQGSVWAEDPDGYLHSKKTSHYLSVKNIAHSIII